MESWREEEEMGTATAAMIKKGSAEIGLWNCPPSLQAPTMGLVQPLQPETTTATPSFYEQPVKRERKQRGGHVSRPSLVKEEKFPRVGEIPPRDDRAENFMTTPMYVRDRPTNCQRERRSNKSSSRGNTASSIVRGESSSRLQLCAAPATNGNLGPKKTKKKKKLCRVRRRRRRPHNLN